MLNQEYENLNDYYIVPDELNTHVFKENQITKREFESLFYLSRGCTFKEIARHMHISPRTVETYIIHLKDKLRVNSRSDLIRLFWMKTGSLRRHQS